MQFCGKNVLSLVERVFASKSFQYFLALVFPSFFNVPRLTDAYRVLPASSEPM